MIIWQSAVQNGYTKWCECALHVSRKENYSHVNYPLERIGAAIQWLKKNGNRKIGIMGMSTAGIFASYGFAGRT